MDGGDDVRSTDSASPHVRPLPRTALRLATAAGLTLAGAALGIALSANAAADEADFTATTGESTPAVSIPSATSALEVTDVDQVSSTDSDTETDTAATSSDEADESSTANPADTADPPPSTGSGTNDGTATAEGADMNTDADADAAKPAVVPAPPQRVAAPGPAASPSAAPENTAPADDATNDAAQAEPTPRAKPILGALGQRALEGVSATVNGVVAPVQNALGTAHAGKHALLPLPDLDGLVPGQHPAPSPDPAVAPAPAEPSPAQSTPALADEPSNPDLADEPAIAGTTEAVHPSVEPLSRTPLVPATTRTESSGAAHSLHAAAEHADTAPAERGLPVAPAGPAGSAGIVAASHDNASGSRHQVGVLPAEAHANPLRLIGTTRTAASDGDGSDTARPTTSPD